MSEFNLEEYKRQQEIEKEREEHAHSILEELRPFLDEMTAVEERELLHSIYQDICKKENEPMSYTKQPLAIWRKSIQSKMQAGMKRKQAVAQTNREHPELQKRIVAEANSTREQSPQAEYTSVEARWNRAVQAKLDLGLSRYKAVQAVSKEKPRLRAAYVKALQG